MRVGVLFDKSMDSGGGFQVEYAILKALSEYGSGLDLIVFTYSWNVALEKELPNAMIVYLPSGLSGKLKTLLSRVFSRVRMLMPEVYYRYLVKKDFFSQLLKNNKIDLMYFLGPSYLANRIETPFVFTVWDLEHKIHPEFPEVRLNGVWERREDLYAGALSRAYAVIADSGVGKASVEYYYRVNPKKVFAVPYIHNLEEKKVDIGTDVTRKFSIQTDYVFYPAQFWPHKNHMLILKAIKCLKEQHGKNITLVTCGSDKGNLSHIKEKVKELGLENNFLYLGFVSNDELTQLYQRALALVMPTFFGPTNIPVYEAFTLGCPVITSDIDGVRDQVGDAGVLVDPCSPEQLTNAIKKLGEDSRFRDELIKNGKARSARWNSRDYYEKISQIINDFDSVRQSWS